MAVTLCGCASNSSPVVDLLPKFFSARFGSTLSAEIPAVPNPAYRYLRVEVEGRPAALLVLGYLDSSPEGEVEVWYSANREVIKTQNGRIVATVGLELDWRAVRFASPPPSWPQALSGGGTYQRSRDVMPGYRHGIDEQISIKPAPGVPDLHLPTPLSAEKAGRLTWLSEVAVGNSSMPVPPAWFALGIQDGQPSVVYSHQCLSADFCLKLLRWPLSGNAL